LIGYDPDVSVEADIGLEFKNRTALSLASQESASPGDEVGQGDVGNNNIRN
jgi:hypothetical protein